MVGHCSEWFCSLFPLAVRGLRFKSGSRFMGRKLLQPPEKTFIAENQQLFVIVIKA